MKKLFIISAIILLSAVAASAQMKSERITISEGQAEAKPARKEDPRVLRVGPSTTYLANGLTISDVKRALGQPLFVGEQQDGELALVTYTFRRSAGRLLVADFENGVLVRSRMESLAETTARKIEPEH